MKNRQKNYLVRNAYQNWAPKQNFSGNGRETAKVSMAILSRKNDKLYRNLGGIHCLKSHV